MLLRIRSVVARTGLSVSTIYRQMSNNEFPRPIRVTPTAVAWKESELEEWLASRPRSTGGGFHG